MGLWYNKGEEEKKGGIGMKAVLFTLNGSWSHTSLALRCLREPLEARGHEVVLVEYTLRDRTSHVLKRLYAERADVYGFSCYIWNIDVRYQVQEDPHLLNVVDLGKEFTHITLHPLEDMAVAVSGVECVLFNPLENGKKTVISEVAATSVKDMKASPDGQYFAILGTNERQVTIWIYQ